MEINDRHVEWAVVNRLKAILETPSKAEFEVTQSFALFSAILFWTKQRVWVGGKKMVDRAALPSEADRAAWDLRKALQTASVFDSPWSLSRVRPQLPSEGRPGALSRPAEAINVDFADMSAEMFVEWLRDAVAHGDGRVSGATDGATISPINRKPSPRGDKTYLEGFEIVFRAKRGSEQKLTLSLYRTDLVRIGSILADAFCKALGGGDEYFERDAATASARIIEAA